jgi:hypothetical protein
MIWNANLVFIRILNILGGRLAMMHESSHFCLPFPNFFVQVIVFYNCHNRSFGLMTKARACKVVGQEEAREWRKVWRNEPSHSQESFHFGNLESQWIPESSEGNCRGQNPMDWGIIYIIEKILKLRCLKWAHMTHWDI